MNEIIKGETIAYSIIKNSQRISSAGEIRFANTIPNRASRENMSGWENTSCNLTRQESIYLRRAINTSPIFDIDIFISWYYNGRVRGAGSYISNATISHVLKRCDSLVGFDFLLSLESLTMQAIRKST